MNVVCVSIACQQPDYQTKDGKLYAIAANGTEVPFAIKGVNWFGMETSLAVPFGLWENQQNGTTAVCLHVTLSCFRKGGIRVHSSLSLSFSLCTFG
jgi:endoglucanase